MKKCKHKKQVGKITATTVEMTCGTCKEELPTRTRVLSSNIFAYARVGNDTEIQFMANGGPGAVYRYLDVPMKKHKQFEAAEHKGEFLAKEIKGQYEFEKLG